MSPYPKKNPTPTTRGNKENQPPAKERAGISSFAERGRWPIFVLYVLFLVWGVTNHESWADEAQSWLIARDADLATLFRLLPSEGHPPLWYLLLMPFAKSGMSYATLKWISAILALCSVYLLLFRTRFHPLVKLLLPFGYVFLFEYARLGRSYSLIIFFIMAIASLYPKRFDRPLLFALCIVGLFNTHVLVFGYAMALVALYAFDAFEAKRLNGKVLLALGVMFIGSVYLLPYLAGAKMTEHFEATATDHAQNFKNVIIGSTIISGNFGLALLLFIALLLPLFSRPKAGIAVLTGIVCTLYILTYRYNGAMRHFMVVFTIIAGGYGIAVHYKDASGKRAGKLKIRPLTIGMYLLSFVVLLHYPASLEMHTKDADKLYSDAGNVASFIKEKFDKETVIVAWQSMRCLSTLPYMPDRKLYYADCQRFGTYYIYDTCFTKGTWMYPVDYAVKVAHDNFKEKKEKVIFLFDYAVMPQTEQYLDLLYVSAEDPIRWDEKFYVYKFKENVK